MSLIPSFLVSQNIGNPIGLVIVDTSTGSDSNITERRVFITNSAGDYLVPPNNPNNTYVQWLVSSGNTITINVLNTDLALNIEVEWVAVINNARLTQDGSLRITQDGNYRVTQ